MAAALWAPLGTLIAVGINQPIADLVGEERPYAILPDILVLAQHTTDPAFASDHAVMAGAVTAGMFLVSRRLGLVAAAAAVLMAFARVYIAAHYPIDVLAGCCSVRRSACSGSWRSGGCSSGWSGLRRARRSDRC